MSYVKNLRPDMQTCKGGSVRYVGSMGSEGTFDMSSAVVDCAG